MVSEGEGDDTGLIQALTAWLEGCDQVPELVEAATQRILQGCVHGGESGPRGPPSSGNKRARPRYRNRCCERYLAHKRAYHKTQYRFKHDPARLAAEILDGRQDTRCPISAEVIHNFFQAKWGTLPPSVGWVNSGRRSVLITLLSWGHSPRVRSSLASGRPRTIPHRAQMGLGSGIFSIGTPGARPSLSCSTCGGLREWFLPA